MEGQTVEKRQPKHLEITDALNQLQDAVEYVESLWMEITQTDNNPPTEVAGKSTQAPSIVAVLDTTPSAILHFCGRLREAADNMRKELFHG